MYSKKQYITRACCSLNFLINVEKLIQILVFALQQKFGSLADTNKNFRPHTNTHLIVY